MPENPAPIPRPPSGPRPRPIYALHPLERIFGFQDPAFTAYMRTKEENVGRFREIYDDLAKADHPILQYAAGSVAMEMALSRGLHSTSPNGSLADRRVLLENAKTAWEQSIEGFKTLWRAGSYPERRAQRNQMRYRVMHFLAYLPLMDVVASQYASRMLTPDQIAEKRQATNEAVVELSERLFTMPFNTTRDSQTQAGLLGEVACGIIAQFESPGYICVPAPLRQDHHPLASKRGDLMALTPHSRRKKWPVQVKNNMDNVAEAVKNSKNQVLVDASRDLVLKPGWSLGKTVRGFTEVVNGKATDETRARLTVVGRVMTQRLDAFALAKMEKWQKG
jgi:hypothetical protein